MWSYIKKYKGKLEFVDWHEPLKHITFLLAVSLWTLNFEVEIEQVLISCRLLAYNLLDILEDNLVQGIAWAVNSWKALGMWCVDVTKKESLSATEIFEEPEVWPLLPNRL